MQGIPLGAAAGGADALEEVLRRKFAQAIQQQQLQQQAERDQATAKHYGAMEQQDAARTALQRDEFNASQKPAPPTPVMRVTADGKLVPVGDAPHGAQILRDPQPPAPPQPKGPMSIAPGGYLVDPNTGKQLFHAPERPQAAQQDGGQFTSVQQVVGPDGKPAMVVVDRRNNKATPVAMPQGFEPNRPARPVTGAERQTLNFFNRMLEAERNARKVEDKLGGGDLAAQQYAPGWMENWLQSPEGQAYTQAQRTYTEARLRKESGAAIPPAEFETDRKTNFRVSGDSKDLLPQKRSSRLVTMRGLGNASGRALQEFYGENATIDDILKEFADQQQAAPKAGGFSVREIK